MFPSTIDSVERSPCAVHDPEFAMASFFFLFFNLFSSSFLLFFGGFWVVMFIGKGCGGVFLIVLG